MTITEEEVVQEEQVKTKAVTEKALSIVDHAKQHIVADESSCAAAAEFVQTVLLPMIAEAKSVFDPICKTTDEAHKAATAARSRVLSPVEQAKSYLSDAIGKWRRDREREEENRRFLEQQAEERRQLEKIEAILDQAHEEGATPADLALICSEPLPAVQVPSRPVYTPKGVVPSKKLTYSAQVRSLKELCRAIAEGRTPEHYVTANFQALNAAVRSAGPQAASFIPGVVAVENKPSVSFRRVICP